jgi:hypothetical protein
MILATHGIIGSGAAFDADAVAFFNRVTTAGGTLSATEKSAINTLVVQMKADGTWTPMKAIYPMVGASAAACAQNLKSSSFTGTFTSGWTFASTGVTPNGTSAYFNTTLNPNTQLTNNNCHMSIYSRTQSRGGYDIGNAVSSNINTLTIDLNISSFNALVEIGSTAAYITSSTSSIGCVIGRRIAQNSLKLNKAASIIATSTGNNSQTSLPNCNISIGARNNNNSFDYYTGRQYAFASIGDGLTDTQASNFYTAVQAFQTTLSRNV